MASLFGEEEASFDDKADDVEADIDAGEVSPRSNPELAGHGEAEKRLLADFNAGRMPHAIILAGPAGIGKATLAYRLARFLLAQQAGRAGLFGAPEPPQSLQIKPDNPVFRRVASAGHADLLTVEREYDEKKERLKNDISVESVRRIAPFLRKTAAEGGWRAVIVDGAECLNVSSQNALLKVLEEPPAKTVLILTTTQPGALLPTIRSRCRLLRLEPLSDEGVSALLDKMAPGLMPEEKSVLLTLAQGSIGRALQYHRDGGVALYKDLMKAAATLPGLDTVLVHELAEKIGRYGAEPTFDAARDIITGWCAEQVRRSVRGQGDAPVFAGMHYPPRQAFAVWEKMSALFRQTEAYNLDRRQAVLNAFLLLQKPDHQGLSV